MLKKSKTEVGFGLVSFQVVSEPEINIAKMKRIHEFIGILKVSNLYI